MSNTVSFDKLVVPAPSNLSAYGILEVPYATVKAERSGPRVLLMAGSHGDEYEGQIALRKISEGFSDGDYHLSHGLVQIIPHVNLPACVAASRFSPIDQGNLSASFYQAATGVTSSIACKIENDFMANADVVLDFHSGGHSLYYKPTAISFIDRDNERFSDTVNLMQEFCVDFLMLKTPFGGGNAVFSAADRKKCIYITAELGGGGQVEAMGIDTALKSIFSILVKLDMMEPDKLRSTGKSQAQWVSVDGNKDRIFAPTDGIIEYNHAAGAPIKRESLLCDIRGFDKSQKTSVFSQTTGIIVANRPLAYCKRGDCLAEIGITMPPPQLGYIA